MEQDTPGQIMGITHKTDGKSNNSSTTENSTASTGETISEKFTQGSREEKNYSKTDKSGTVEFEKENDSIPYKFLGMAIVIIGVFLFMNNQSQAIVEYERDQLFAERAAEAKRVAEAERAEAVRQQNLMEAQNNAIIRQSKDILKENPLRSI